MKRYTHLIWDFNGTLLNDVGPDFNAANRLLARHGLPPLASLDDYRRAFGFPIIDYYRRLGFDFAKTPYEELAAEWIEDYRTRPERTTLFPEVPGILQTVRAWGIPQILLSATEAGMLAGQLAETGIGPLFEEIIGAGNYHAYGKADLAAAWRERNPEARPLMIGDTVHDAEIARVLGADVILLACGHQARQTLEQAHPLLICDRPGTIPLAQLLKEER